MRRRFDMSFSSYSSPGCLAPAMSGISLRRSAPELKALSPAPVMIATRKESSSAKSCQASARRTTTSASRALWTSGRLRMM